MVFNPIAVALWRVVLAPGKRMDLAHFLPWTNEEPESSTVP